MFAQPENSGIAVAVARDLSVPDPEITKAMEILNDKPDESRDSAKGVEQGR